MQKFLFKFFILFVLTISGLFFALVGFQKITMEHSMEGPQPSFAPARPFESVSYPGMPVHPQKPPLKSPPVFIPAFLIVFLSSLFVFFLLKYLDKNFISPLVEIKKKVKNIKDGSLDVEFRAQGEDATVKETFETLNSMVLGLKEKEKFRENFISMLTHDLRTPLLAQERAIAILKDEFSGHELLDGMLENNEEYLSMINLIVEAFSAADVKIKKDDFNLLKLVDTVLLALKPSAVAKNINIEVKIPENFTIFGDYISFHRIFMNLISNSIDNIDKGKTIKIEAIKTNGKSVLSVFDNGNGIDDETLSHIFDKYASFKKSKGKTVSGLGLYIANELVEKNGGEIHIETEPGAFTKFIIEI